ncbi:hypothetical protein [Blastopirellula retiformator]|uniref:Uncharacterized protein n=1 Tax=Blastopirellula retiformator TaxID=2527970 RepID=A0A5C5UTC8_9BACT|nr:hypothetical protein [Blastopirellula retiformator]TWT29641.1 hypothetical protein Enr8_48290 [Blastopirellula retiformator]
MSTATFSRIAGAENQSDSLIDAELADFLDILQLLIRELEEVGARVQYSQGVLVAQGSRPYDLVLSARSF